GDPEDREPRPDGRRDDQPRRARVRHLLPTAEGSDHLPRHPGRRPDRQPDHRPDALPRPRGSRAGYPPLHQLPGWRHLRRAGDLRHDADDQAGRRHLLPRDGREHGRGAPGGRCSRQALRPAERPHPDPPGLRRLQRRRPRHRGRGAGGADALRQVHLPPGGPLRAALRQGQARQRPRLLPERAGSEGVRPRRRGPRAGPPGPDRGRRVRGRRGAADRHPRGGV
ncbi:MAG: ATP-dependent Clp protease proteolytic subunit, partial [uncultured Thermomicrobiales bacterium]